MSKNLKVVGALLLVFAIMVTMFSYGGIPYRPKVYAKTSNTVLMTVKGTVTLKLTVNKKTINNKKAVWKSKNKKIAKVSKKGVVTGIKKGSTKIIATYKKKKYTYKVVVAAGTPISKSLSKKELARYQTYDWLPWSLSEPNKKVSYKEFAAAVTSMQNTVKKKAKVKEVNGSLKKLIGTKMIKETSTIPVSDAMVMLYLAAWSLDAAEADMLEGYEYPALSDARSFNFEYSYHTWEDYGVRNDSDEFYIYWNSNQKWFSSMTNCTTFYATMASTPYSGNSIFYNDFTEKAQDFKKDLTASDATKYLCRAYESIMSMLAPEQRNIASDYKKLFDKRRESILNSKTEVECKGTAYYVAENGDDNNDGKSVDAPWKSVNRVQQAGEDGTLKDGDVVYFRRGDEFPGYFKLAGKNVTYSAYGTGDKPKLTGQSDVDFAKDSSRWTLYSDEGGKKIWLYRDSTQYVSNLFFNDGEAHGVKVVAVYQDGTYYSLSDLISGDENKNTKLFDIKTELDDNLDFFFDGDYLGAMDVEKAIEMEGSGAVMGNLYLRCDAGNPAKIYKKIRGCGYNLGLQMFGGETLDNLNLCYNSYHYTHDAVIQNCECGFNGGFINGVANDWKDVVMNGDAYVTGGNNITIKDCYAHDILDNALHIETSGSIGKLSNIRISGCLAERCGGRIQLANFEKEWPNAEEDSTVDFENVTLEDNYIVGASDCMGLQQRAYMKTGIRYQCGLFMTRENTTKVKNVSLINNIFYRFYDRPLIYCANHDEYAPKFSGNTYVQYGSEIFGGVWNKDLESMWFVGSDHAEELAYYLGDTEGKVIVS